MKNLCYILVFFVFSAYSQRNYKFDYLSEYKIYYYKNEEIKLKKVQYLTNSKNNNYIAKIHEKDSVTFKIVFSDYNNKFTVFFIPKKEFLNSSTIEVPESYLKKNENKAEYQINNYDFYPLKDTLYNGKTCSHYKISSINTKRAIRKKVGTYHYIIDNDTKFHKPILVSPIQIAEWKSKKNIPNGIHLEKFFIDYLGVKRESWKHIRTEKTLKKIIIVSDNK